MSQAVATVVKKLSFSTSSDGDHSETISTSSDGDRSEMNLGEILRPMITSFVDDIGFTGAAPGPSQAFWLAMREYADKTGVNYDEGTHSWKCFRVGLSYSSVCRLASTQYLNILFLT